MKSIVTEVDGHGNLTHSWMAKEDWSREDVQHEVVSEFTAKHTKGVQRGHRIKVTRKDGTVEEYVANKVTVTYHELTRVGPS